MTAPADDTRDAHLLAALRHAPDHEAGPPPALSAQIRARARQALPAPTPPTDPGWFERWFGWMSRPLAAGAFGTLLIAGFVGLMWREGPPPDALPGADRPAPAPAVADAVPASAPPAATRVVAPAPPIPPSPPPPARPAAAQKAAESARARADAAPVPAAAPPSLAEARVTLERSPAPAPVPPVATPPAFAPTPAPAPAPTPAAAPAPAPARATAPAAAAPAAPLGAAGQVGASARARDNAAAPAAARLAPPQAESAPDLSADPLAAAIAAADGPWRERLRTVRLQTQGRWALVDTLPDSEGETVTGAAGQRLGRLRVLGPHITWQAADGRTWRATLPERSESAGSAPSR